MNAYDEAAGGTASTAQTTQRQTPTHYTHASNNSTLHTLRSWAQVGIVIIWLIIWHAHTVKPPPTQPQRHCIIHIVGRLVFCHARSAATTTATTTAGAPRARAARLAAV